MDRTKLAYVLTTVVSITILVFFVIFFRIYANWLWFSSLNFASVFWTVFWTKVIAGFIFGLIFLLLLGFNIYWAMCSSARSVGSQSPTTMMDISEDEPVEHPDEDGEEEYDEDEGGTLEVYEQFQPFSENERLKYLLISVGAFFTLIAAMVGLSRWDLFLRYFNQQSFSLKEPIFFKDISFFVFSLPVLKFIYGWLFISLVGIAGIVIYIYYMRNAIVSEEGQFRFADCVKTHLYALGGAVMLLIAFRYWLKVFELLYSSRGFAFGANYTDVYVQMWAFRFLIFAAIISAVAIIANIQYRRGNLSIIAVGSFIGAILLVSVIIPRIIQRFVVEPSELRRDRRYIQYNIQFTRRAYNLDNIKEDEFAAKDDLTRQDIVENDRQVMLSARELPISQLPRRTWVNEKLQYTHGYGLTMSPVNQVTSQGLPQLFVKDIPPVSSVNLPIERPGIYYGEQTNSYVIVGTKEDEIDYPEGDKNVYTQYQGKGGVPINSFFRRLAFSIKFFDLKLLVTSYLTDESRILLNRSLYQRLRAIAPFLRYDADPYLVLWDGKLYWIQDAYTITNMYPYSERFQKDVNLNYIRNSVKVVVDAYNGSLSFYVTDEVDPIIKTYMKIFPKLFVPLSEMPAGLKAHVRYPKDLFKIQAYMYRLYHMQDVQVFYNQEDLWAIPYEMYSDVKRLMTPYYVTLKLPDSQREEFVLILPFTPSNKDNMISWLAARSDFPHYGELLVYKVSKKNWSIGPLQVEARIDQQPEISSQFTLWTQKGSRVIRGNLLVIPIENSFIYVEPVYLEAQQDEQALAQQQSQMSPEEGQEQPRRMARRQRRPQRPRRSKSAALPELKQVIVVYGEQVVMRDSLDAALEAIFWRTEQTSLRAEGKAITSLPVIQAPKGRQQTGLSPTTEVYDAAASAMEHYQKARESVQKWDWTTFNQELDKVEESLRKIMELEKRGR